MLLRNLILPGVIVPAVVAGLVFVLVSWLRKRERKASGAGALAIAGGLLSAYVALTGWPRWPPVEATQRVFYVVGAAAILTAGFAFWRRAALPWIVRAIVLVALLALVLESQIENRWSATQSTVWIVGLSFLGLVLGWALHRSLREEAAARGRLFSAATRLALLGSTALVLGLSKSVLLAQLTGAIACAMTTVELIGLLRGKSPWHGADAHALQLAVIGLLLTSYFYASLDWLPAVLVVAAFILLGLTTGGSTLLRLTPLVPMAVAVGIVVVAYMNQPEDPYADYYADARASQERSTPLAFPLDSTGQAIG